MNYQQQLQAYIQSHLLSLPNAGGVGYDDDLLLSGLLDSLGVIRLLAFIQEAFGIAVPAEDVVIEHFATINAIATYLMAHAQTAATAR